MSVCFRLSNWTQHDVVVVTLLSVLLVLMNLTVTGAVYTNQVAVHIEGGSNVAHRIAKRHGFINLGQIGELEDHYLFEHPHILKRSASISETHHVKLEEECEVKWFEQQQVLSRQKRGFTEKPYTMTDPNWEDQWYLHREKHMDMNVIPAWYKGYSGKGVVITILDDGIESNHTDLKDNYDAEASYDINGRDADPMPRYDLSNENRHGTRCAGEVSASANNTMCGVGVAFQSGIGGVRMLDGDVTDAVEAAALSLNPQHIDIYSASWGPDDDGRVVDGPGKLAKQAFINGITKGRNGKGCIFVWASGNGGHAHDSCNCDGYTNSIFTLSVSSTTEVGNKPWYLEECSSTLAATYSSGGYRQRQIVTTDLHNLCTKTHTGTSAAAPLAAGIVALVLEANPNLTWRDVQYITMLTARTEPFIDADWMTNSLGRKVSLKYGYGLMDASAMVDMAENWVNVPQQQTCEKQAEQTDISLTGSPYSTTIVAEACEGQANSIRFVEHVQINVTLSYSRRGDISLHLTSPKGTKSTLLPKRQNDRYQAAFNNWPFMSVHFWGEDPRGTWKLEIANEGVPTNHGMLSSWSLRLHGTASDPLSKIPITQEVTKSPSPTTPTTPKITCHSECAGGCTGNKPEDCDACKNYRMEQHGACVAVCPNGTYVNTSRVCVRCDSTCEMCTGPSETDCLSCFGGWFYMTENNTCVMECPQGYFKEDPWGRCTKCSSPCQTCQGTSETCTSCIHGERLQDGRCVSNTACRETEFQNSEGSCEKCHISCGTCSGPALDQCISCVNDEYLVTHLQENTCVENCHDGFYLSQPNESRQTAASCQRCDMSCVTCSGPLSTDCITCQPGQTVTSGICHGDLNCTNSQFIGSGQCLDCHASCLTCKGPSHTDCLTCAQGSKMNHGECVAGCVAGTFPVATKTREGQTISECTPCHETCASCHGDKAGDCITCRPPLQVDNGLCKDKTCSQSEYLDLDMGLCQACHFTCASCRGAELSDCLSCSFSYLMDGRCVAQCPEGFYTASDNLCQPCTGMCRKCKGPKRTDCTLCGEGYTLQEGACYQECPAKEFFNKELNSCFSCHPSCGSCTGNHPDQCVSCDMPLMYHKPSSRCLPCCSSSHGKECCSCQTTHNAGECLLMSEESSDDTPYKELIEDRHSGASVGFVSMIVFLCALPFVMAILVFVTLQLRSNHKLCWRHDYSKVSLKFDPLEEKLTPYDDDGDDEELFTNNTRTDPNHNKDIKLQQY